MAETLSEEVRQSEIKRAVPFYTRCCRTIGPGRPTKALFIVGEKTGQPDAPCLCCHSSIPKQVKRADDKSSQGVFRVNIRLLMNRDSRGPSKSPRSPATPHRRKLFEATKGFHFEVHVLLSLLIRYKTMAALIPSTAARGVVTLCQSS